MNVNDILKLVNAGFSKDEISAMISAEPGPKLEGPAPKQPEPAPKQPEPAPKQEAPAPKQEEPKQESSVDFSGLNAAIETLTKKIQGINIAAAELPEPESVQDKADRILASIINPPRKAD